MNNDAELHTGVDNEPEGLFGNEVKDEQTSQAIQEQNRLLSQLSPKIEALLKTIDNEIERVMSIDRFISAANEPDINIRAELQAAALYKGYLGELKTKFKLNLQEVKSKKK